MRNLLLFLSMLISAATANAQIADGEFENWNITSYDDLAQWTTSNSYSVQAYNLTAVTKVAGIFGGNAVRIENKASGTDTVGGYISNTDGDPTAGEGGMPYTLQATSFKGYARYNIVSGDTALIFVVFKKNGNIISNNVFKITGSQSTLTLFNYAITMPVAPDSVIVAAASSNLMNASAVLGSWLELDSLFFSNSSSSAAFTNSGFENWNTITNQELTDWNSFGGTTLRTTDKYSGTYAARLISLDDGSGFINPASIGQQINLNKRIDTLTGYYKYTSKVPDTGMAMLVLFDSNTNFIDQIYYYFQPQSTYTYFKIPLESTPLAASALIRFYSHNFGFNNPPDSSSLYLDKLEIKPQVLGVKDLNNIAKDFRVFPNPVKDMLHIKVLNDIKGNIDVALYDEKGSVVYHNNHSISKGALLSIPVAELAAGTYIYEIRTDEGFAKDQFIKQ